MNISKNKYQGSKRKEILIAALVIFGVTAVTGFGSTYYVGTNSFCGSCHQMKTRYELWRKSSHKQVNCIKCHSEPGIIGEAKAHIDGLNYLKSFLKDKTTHATIFATRRNPARLKACIYCHPENTLIDETENLKIDHVAHVVNEKFLCTDCHSDMIHGTSSFEVDKDRPKEEKCIACHLKKGADTTCQGCHKKKVRKRMRQIFVLEALQEASQEPALNLEGDLTKPPFIRE